MTTNDKTKPALSVRAALQAILTTITEASLDDGAPAFFAEQIDAANAALAAPFGLTVDQESKYTVDDFGKIITRATGIAIPDDEPVMIFRARDDLARQPVRRYVDLLPEHCGRGSGFRDSAFERSQAFIAFAERYPERMKKPD